MTRVVAIFRLACFLAAARSARPPCTHCSAPIYYFCHFFLSNSLFCHSFMSNSLCVYSVTVFCSRYFISLSRQLFVRLAISTTTLLATFFHGYCVFWCSVGSPLKIRKLLLSIGNILSIRNLTWIMPRYHKLNCSKNLVYFFSHHYLYFFFFC